MKKIGDEYSYSFKVSKSKLVILKEALAGENSDISKFLRNAIDRKVAEYKIELDCVITSSKCLDCEDCESYKACPSSPYVKRVEAKKADLMDEEIKTIFGGK
jgi:hypothetical protein